MARKPPPDWDAIEKLYRTGTLSNRQIAEKFECGESAIRDRAKRYDWVKDLDAAVKAKTAQKVLRNELRTQLRESPSGKLDEGEIIEAASDMRAAIDAGMKVSVNEAHAVADMLRGQLRRYVESTLNLNIVPLEDIAVAVAVLKELAASDKHILTIKRTVYGFSDKVPDTPAPSPETDAKLREMQRFMHEHLTRGKLARPGGPLEVIDVKPQPVQQPQPSAQKARR